jgi:drug/metabolite transporter (DMT)-like permease
MQLVAIALGVCAALFWGLADSLATLSVRRITTFQTTLVSQIASLLALNVLLIFGHAFSPSITIGLSLENVGAGILIGTCTFVAYIAIYRALEVGPIAITSPLSSASAIITLLLSVLILHEHVSFSEAMALTVVMLGIVLISTSYQDILNLLQKRSSGFSVSKGILWAYVAMFSLGCVFFGLGARTPSAGWFVPIYWARTFSVLLLCLTAFSTTRRKRQISLDARTSNTGWFAPAYWTHMFSVLLFCTSAFYIMRQRGPKSILDLLQKLVSLLEQQKGILLALAAGILDGIALSFFGLATQLMQPGVLSVIISNYTVVCVIFGIFILRERLVANQVFGIFMVIGGVAGLAYLRP